MNGVTNILVGLFHNWQSFVIQFSSDSLITFEKVQVDIGAWN